MGLWGLLLLDAFCVLNQDSVNGICEYVYIAKICLNLERNPVAKSQPNSISGCGFLSLLWSWCASSSGDQFFEFSLTALD